MIFMSSRSVRIPLGLVCLMSVAIWSCGDDDTQVNQNIPTTGEIKGTVIDAVSGQPVHQALITTLPSTQSVATGTDGTFALQSVAPGQYSLTVVRAGYSHKVLTIQVEAGGTAKADVLLEKNATTNALKLDGSDDYVIVPFSPALNLSQGSFTVEAYVYADTFHTTGLKWNWIVGHGTSNDDLDYLIGFEAAYPVFSIRSRGTVLKGSQKLETKRWYHIAGVVDVTESKVRMYVDGNVAAQGALSGTGVNSAGDIFIGARESLGTGNAAEFFGGLIYELRLWNQSRSSAELHQTMKAPLSGIEEGLVGYWRLDEGQGGVINDHSGGGNLGQVVGNPPWLSVLNPMY